MNSLIKRVFEKEIEKEKLKTDTDSLTQIGELEPIEKKHSATIYSSLADTESIYHYECSTIIVRQKFQGVLRALVASRRQMCANRAARLLIREGYHEIPEEEKNE